MSDTGIVRTAFDGVQQRMGVELMDWEGWYWPNHFGDAVAEHNTVREHVGVWDESPLRKWDFNGPDALAAADRIFTNDMLGLEIGQVRYAPFCDANGKMVGDGTVFKFTDTSCWVVTALDSDLDHFQNVVDGMQVEIEPITEKLPHLQIQGPKSRELLADLTDESVEDLGYFRFFPHQVHVGRVPVWVSRTGYSGELGYEVFTDPDYAEELWEAVSGAGAKPYASPRSRRCASSQGWSSSATTTSSTRRTRTTCRWTRSLGSTQATSRGRPRSPRRRRALRGGWPRSRCRATRRRSTAPP